MGPQLHISSACDIQAYHLQCLSMVETDRMHGSGSTLSCVCLHLIVPVFWVGPNRRDMFLCSYRSLWGMTFTWNLWGGVPFCQLTGHPSTGEESWEGEKKASTSVARGTTSQDSALPSSWVKMLGATGWWLDWWIVKINKGSSINPRLPSLSHCRVCDILKQEKRIFILSLVVLIQVRSMKPAVRKETMMFNSIAIIYFHLFWSGT